MNRLQHPWAKKQDRAGRQRPTPVIEGLLRNALRHHRAGRLTEAARIYRQILAMDAHQADSLDLLGMIAYQAGGHELAVAMIRKAIAINKDEASYHSNLGTVLQSQGKLEEAAACYELALTLKPDLAEVHCNLGNILQAQDKLDEAVTYYERALALKPDLAEAHHSMGNALQTQDKLDDAVACYERALALKPDHARAYYNLGCALRGLGNVDEALVRYRMALTLQPNYVQAGFRESLAQLLKGDFTLGWHNYERRWQSYPKDHGTPMRAYPLPLWTGEKLASGRLLIWGEQGVGDEIMFAGLIPDVTRTGNGCALDCDARLKPLFARSFPGIDVVSGHVSGDDPRNDPAHNPQLDIAAHLPSGSLPRLFRATGAAFAATTSPYLIADPVARERFRARYADAGADGNKKRRLVGLAWHTTNRKTGRSRSIDLSLFAPLFNPLFAPASARHDIRWVSLQYGDHDALESQAAAASAPILIDRTVDQLSNIDIFAAQIAAMDMVVTIDNSTAHLAGALGVPVWVLLPFAPDWRWLLACDDSPWYPTMRLFRQPKRGDWQSVMQRVQRAL
jgi:tetratricopeptide (TPR) repeat protein